MKHQHDELKMPFHLKPGAVVVFEGLDRTGKSTQHGAINKSCYFPDYGIPLFDTEPLFLHMPSGDSEIGEQIYQLTEGAKGMDPLTRQFLHLAAHAQALQDTILPALDEGKSVWLDRWWWSTYAYGFAGGRLHDRGWSRNQFIRLCGTVWDRVKPDVIFLFMHPHDELEATKYNLRVENAYMDLAEHVSPRKTVLIEPGDKTQQRSQIFDALAERGLYGSGA